MFALDVTSGKKTLLVGDDRDDVVNAGVSPDGLWMSFVVFDGGHARLFNASIAGASVSTYAQWIPVTPPDAWDDKPRWSLSSDLLYFVSNRDGFLCSGAAARWRDEAAPGRAIPRLPFSPGEPVDDEHTAERSRVRGRQEPDRLHVTRGQREYLAPRAPLAIP